THPELLDWLAARFVGVPSPGSRVSRQAASDPRLGTQDPGLTTPWSLKQLHRLIMLSATYRQASTAPVSPQSLPSQRPTLDAQRPNPDPEIHLLWRSSRHRLEGEAIRDACLAVSGELSLKMGGPSVFPEIPEGVSTRGGWPVSKTAEERNRRSV